MRRSSQSMLVHGTDTYHSYKKQDLNQHPLGSPLNRSKLLFNQKGRGQTINPSFARFDPSLQPKDWPSREKNSAAFCVPSMHPSFMQADSMGLSQSRPFAQISRNAHGQHPRLQIVFSSVTICHGELGLFCKARPVGCRTPTLSGSTGFVLWNLICATNVANISQTELDLGQTSCSWISNWVTHERPQGLGAQAAGRLRT